MAVKLTAPNRLSPVVDSTGNTTLRTSRFFEEVRSILETATTDIDTLETDVTALETKTANIPGGAVSDAAVTAGNITITWTANEPTASTSQTIANGNAVTGAEAGQAIKNINAQIGNLDTDVETLKNTINALILSLENAGVINT